MGDVIVDYQSIGSRIREVRLQSSMTQQQLAEKADISTNYLSHIENGLAKFSLNNLLKIIYALDTTPNRILCNYKMNESEIVLEDVTVLIKGLDNKKLEYLEKYIYFLKGFYIEKISKSEV